MCCPGAPANELMSAPETYWIKTERMEYGRSPQRFIGLMRHRLEP